MVCCSRSSTSGVQARGRRHIEPFLRKYPLRIVNQNKWRSIVAGAIYAGSSMGFITENQIKLRRPLSLCALDQRQRMIGAEHHRHCIYVCSLEGLTDGYGVCGRWNLKFINCSIFSLLSCTCIRTDTDIAMRDPPSALPILASPAKIAR